MYCLQIKAQADTSDVGNIKIQEAASGDSSARANEKDIIDVLRRLLRLKPSQKSDTILPGDKPVISVIPAVGYTLQTRWAAILSGNIAFFTGTQPDARLSVVSASPTYTQNRQFTIPVQLNIWLQGDKFNLPGDWRFMKYPQSTFGLGSNSPLANENPMKYDYIRIHQYVLRKIVTNFSAGIGYNLDYHWDISESGLASMTASDYVHYGAQKESTSSGLALNIVYDSRDNPINSTRGLFAGLILRNNEKWLGSDTRWRSAILDLRKYWLLPGHSKNILSFWTYNWIVLDGRPPYLDLPSTGWDNFNNTGRGFIQGRFRGNVMLYAESEYRFRIAPNGLIGGVVFVNAQSFSGAPSKQPERMQVGKGLGLRIKLNKKSRTNIAIDYGFGTDGMRGFFVNIGEVF